MPAMRGIKLVIGLVLVASPAAADQVSVKKLDKSGTYDCAKNNPFVSIGNGRGTYTFKGECKMISVGGGQNKLTVEAVDSLEVNGAMNTITVTTVGTIDVGGTMNKIAWKKAKTGDKPALRGQPDKNTITQSK